MEISGGAVRHNFRLAQSVVSRSTRIMPIVKANAYGHGVREVVRALQASPKQPWAFGLAYGEEALSLRSWWSGRIVVLSYWQPHELRQLIAKRIDIVIWNWESLNDFLKLTTSIRQRARLHLKLDTGTSRIGFVATDVPQLRVMIEHYTLPVVGIFSHFAHAEERSLKRTAGQLNRFTTLAKCLDPKQGTIWHIACTAASMRLRKAQFGLVRLGLGLYGLSPAPSVISVTARNQDTGFRPALTWKTKISQIKTVPTGTGIGYGGSYVAKKRLMIATLPIGYADGYDRRLSNCGWVVIKGKHCPVRGRVCMNLTMVDVSNVPAKVGDEVTLLGRGVTADDIAKTIHTINYEVVTGVNWDIPRILV